MTLDKEDIATAKEMAQTLQKSRNSELIVVGNLLSHLLVERVAPQRTWAGLSIFEINDLVQSTPYDEYHCLVEKTEALLKEKNT